MFMNCYTQFSVILKTNSEEELNWWKKLSQINIEEDLEEDPFVKMIHKICDYEFQFKTISS